MSQILFSRAVITEKIINWFFSHFIVTITIRTVNGYGYVMVEQQLTVIITVMVTDSLRLTVIIRLKFTDWQFCFSDSCRIPMRIFYLSRFWLRKKMGFITIISLLLKQVLTFDTCLTRFLSTVFCLFQICLALYWLRYRLKGFFIVGWRRRPSSDNKIFQISDSFFLTASLTWGFCCTGSVHFPQNNTIIRTTRVVPRNITRRQPFGWKTDYIHQSVNLSSLVAKNVWWTCAYAFQESTNTFRWRMVTERDYK